MPPPLRARRGRRRRLLPLLIALLAAAPAARAQDAAPPPPPPAEALDPATAPASSTHPEHADEGPRRASTHAPHAVQTPNRVDPSLGARAASDPDASPAGGDGSPLGVFHLEFMWRALLAGLIVGGVCAYLGLYVVLRRIVFVGVALSEMSSAGVAFALLTGIAPMLGSVGLMLAGVALFSVRWAPRKVRQDAFIGVGYVVASALAILLIAKSPHGEGHLLDLLFGNILTVTWQDVWATALALAAVVACHALFAKELLFVSFDPDTAQAAGYRTRFWESLLYVTIGTSIAFAIHAVGVLLTSASLVIPAVTALLLTRRMGRAVVAAVVAGTLPVPVGLYLSFVRDLPPAATIVAVGFLVLLVVGGVDRVRTA
jgi:ABC-type Mn2+/Zn2+ transport system permease subunit